MNKKILFIVGSIRKNSLNRQLAKAAEEIIGERADITFLEYADLPYMNQDIEFPAPEAVERVRKQVRDADGIWIFTPEYNYQIPGVLKNLLDWLSRPVVSGERSTAAAFGKPVTISGAGGKGKTAGCRKNLDALLEAMRMQVMKENETGLALSPEEFAGSTLAMDDERKRQLSAQAEAFLELLA